jgi:hypothetical protein
VSSEARADRIDDPVRARSRQTVLRAWTASFIGKPERQLQLYDPIRFEIRDGDRQQRDRLLGRVNGKDTAHEMLGGLSESPRSSNRRRQREGARDRAQIGEADADRDRPAYQ